MRDLSNWITRTHDALTRTGTRATLSLGLNLAFRIFELITKKIFTQILYWNTRWIPKKGKILFVKTSVIILIWYWCNCGLSGFFKTKSSKCIWTIGLIKGGVFLNGIYLIWTPPHKIETKYFSSIFSFHWKVQVQCFDLVCWGQEQIENTFWDYPYL